MICGASDNPTGGAPETLFRSAFDCMGSPTAIFDEDNCFETINQKFAQILGYSPAELEGKRRWMEFVVPDDLKRMMSYHESRIGNTGEAPPAYEFGLICRDGIIRNMLVHVVLIPGTKKSVASLVDITDRKRAEEEVLRTGNLYRAIFENTGTASVLIEEDATISLANTRWEELSGYSKDELEGRIKWTAFVVPEDLGRMMEYHRKRRENPDSAPGMYEFRFIRRNGDVRDIIVHVVMIPGTKRSIASLLDITERKKAEKALRQSKRLLGDIIDFLPDATFAIDLQGRVTAWNRAIEVMTGYPKKEMMGKGNYEYSIPFYGEKRPILIDMAYYDEKDISGKYQNVRKESGLLVAETFVPGVYNGRGAFLWGIVALLHDSDGNVTGAIESIRDISEYKRVETALRESENIYRAIFENTGSATIIIEEDTTIAMVNTQWVNLSGFSKEEQEGKMSWTEFVVPEDLERMVHYHNERRGEFPDVPWMYEFRFRSRNGEIHNVVVHIVMIPGTKRSIASLVDITDRKRAEDERFRIERQLLHSQKLESLGLLAGGIAHDFNNLLLAVLGNLDIALMKLSPSDPARNNIEQAIRAGRHATGLTRQMLAYSGKGNFVITRVDLGRLVEENYQMLRVAIPRTITLNLRLAEDLPVIMADAGQIQQVVLNLITNAAEAIGDDQGEIILSTGSADCDAGFLSLSRIDIKPRPGKFVWIEVRDTGCGMDDITLQKLFDPFYTTKFTGRGLGMSAVMGVVMGHGGAITIDSSQGGGTEIRALFPAAPRCDQDDALKQDVNTDRPADEMPRCSGTVLVVDDEEMIVNMTCEMVELCGFRTLRAGDGDEAVNIFSSAPDEIICVILDLTMPRMDGLATFTRLRAIKPGIQVILASGYSEQDATSRFAGQGLAGFIQKPYSMETLENELRKITAQ